MALDSSPDPDKQPRNHAEAIDGVNEYSVFFCVLPWRTGAQWGQHHLSKCPSDQARSTVTRHLCRNGVDYDLRSHRPTCILGYPGGPVHYAITHQPVPVSCPATPIQSAAQSSAAARASRASCGWLFCSLRWAATTCCNREVSMSPSRPAA